MHCTLLGGGGFIGSAIADRLLLDGHRVRIFERPRVQPYRQFLGNESVEWQAGDLQSAHDIDAAIAGSDAVIHLVSTTLPKSSNDDPVFDVQSNLVSTLNLLDAMVRRRIGRLVFISSGGTVYGASRGEPVAETHPTEPQVSYGIVKLAIEKYILMYQRLHGLRGIVLRVSNPYGERQRTETAQGAVSVFLRRALRGETIDIWGDGSVARDYIHVADVAEAFALALAYDGTESVFNIGSGSAVSLNALLERIERQLGQPVSRRHTQARAFDVPVSVLDNTLALRELGWSPKVGLEEGLARTIGWMRGEPAAQP
jgi:UDP-glucose 4-epimerase